MLHEVLLALSGHPSPLFIDLGDNDFPLLSPSERALLRSIGRLSEVHRRLKRHLEDISSTHSSIVCRAVATSIQQTHLARFQQTILDVESSILKRDASMVGAYNIVPLASVVGEFDDWHRLMAWYWQVACYMQQPTESGNAHPNKHSSGCTGALMIDKLRSETQTGYPEVEDAAVQLTRVAETAWLRQLSGWVVYGTLPPFGAQDFFVQPDTSSSNESFIKRKDLLPAFVSRKTASSILFIGKSLHQVQNHRNVSRASSLLSSTGFSDTEVASEHLRVLSQLSLPIVASQLSRTVSEVRQSLSRNVLQHLLPMGVTIQVLSCLRLFFLLNRGEFAVALVSEAENRLNARQQNMGRLLQQDPVRAMQGLSIKDAALSQALLRVWKAMAAEADEMEDEMLDFAQRHITLAAAKTELSRPSTADSMTAALPTLSTIAFNDLLFPSPTELSLSVVPPLDLFLSSHDISTYSVISSYLLAIRRGHHRLSDLWRRTSARRTHPVASAREPGARSRNNKRATAMRKVWATCSAAIFLLSETAAFFEGEIIKGSCDHFHRWVQGTPPTISLDGGDMPLLDIPPEPPIQRDPETLASGHRAFLASLTYALLLTDVPYTAELRSLLGNVDNLIAFFTRLLDLQQKLDLEKESGEESALTVEEESYAALDLDRWRKRVDSAMKSVVSRLRQLDHERIGSLRYLNLKPVEDGDFEVWKGGSVDRLLMKLEFGRMVNAGYEIA